jgi:hypothetical protein
MAFTYKIRSFDATAGSVVISVHNDAAETIGGLNVDLPRDDAGLYLVGTPLNDYIMGFIPADWYQRSEEVKAGVANASAITALVEALPAEDPVVEEDAITGNDFIDLRLKHHSLID